MRIKLALIVLNAPEWWQRGGTNQGVASAGARPHPCSPDPLQPAQGAEPAWTSLPRPPWWGRSLLLLLPPRLWWCVITRAGGGDASCVTSGLGSFAVPPSPFGLFRRIPSGYLGEDEADRYSLSMCNCSSMIFLAASPRQQRGFIISRCCAVVRSMWVWTRADLLFSRCEDDHDGS